MVGGGKGWELLIQQHRREVYINEEMAVSLFYKKGCSPHHSTFKRFCVLLHHFKVLLLLLLIGVKQ